MRKCKSMKRQPTWDKYEVALLIEAYIRIENGEVNKSEALQKVSATLRAKAIIEGRQIDDTFRNMNGMLWQIGFIDCAFKNSGYGSHMPSKMFKSTVELYQKDKRKFSQLLYEAKKKAGVLDSQIESGLNERYDENVSSAKGKPVDRLNPKNDLDKAFGCYNNLVHEENVTEEILEVVAKKFIYGFRIGSVIELIKLREYLSEGGVSFSGTDEELETLIKSKGIISNGKVFLESAVANEKIEKTINSLFEKGISVIYFSCFIDSYQELLDEVHITSEDVLKDLLIKKRIDLFFSRHFVSNKEKMTEEVAVSSEINRVWKDEILLSIEQLSERLPYIPKDKIRFFLSANNEFVWVSEGVYTRIDTLLVTEDEEKNIIEFVNKEIEKTGFVSLSDIPLGDIIEQNYELTESSILNAIFNKFLSRDFFQNGKIITKEKSSFDAVAIMKQCCVDKDVYTLDEAIQKVEELTGSADRRIAYLALYDVMVRVGEQKFVSNKFVDFDIHAIDRVIDSLVKDGYAATKEITSFALFPVCGQSWNTYLLESYCYRFSYQFRYRTNLFNGRNAGAIVDSKIDWDYKELLSHAAARSKIDFLDAEIIGQYLYETGYMARSKFGWLEDIAVRAKEIREEGNNVFVYI